MMARETKKKLRNDIRILARRVMAQDECVELLVKALPDSKQAIAARIGGLQAGNHYDDLWPIGE